MIEPRYDTLTPADYADKINSPSQIPEYFRLFHAPLIEEAKKEAKIKSPDGRITVIDVACGHGYELDFMKGDPSLDIVGLDLAVDTLTTSTRKRFNPNVDKTVKARFIFVGGDTEHPPLAENKADVGMAVNAAIYKPEFLLSTLYRALKPRAKCVVNFRVYGDPDNRPFFDTQVERRATIRDATLEDRKQLSLPLDETIPLKIVDYSTHEDEQLRSLGCQTYFTSTEDIERLFTKIGFELADHVQFRYKSHDNENPGNRIEVYTLEKPKT